MKTHKGTAKRVHITGTGKFMMVSHHRNNKRRIKRAEKLYALRGMEVVHATHSKRLRRLLPGTKLAK